MDRRIERFIEEQKNMTLCTSVENIPHCANCFYSYLAGNHWLIFKSDRKTKHITDVLQNTRVAGTIIPDITKTGLIKGIQFSGELYPMTSGEREQAARIYYFRFPFALAMPGDLWAIHLLSIKMTDNSLGFGKKLHWRSSSPKHDGDHILP